MGAIFLDLNADGILAKMTTAPLDRLTKPTSDDDRPVIGYAQARCPLTQKVTIGIRRVIVTECRSKFKWGCAKLQRVVIWL